MKKRFMAIALVLSLVFASLALTGCGDNKINDFVGTWAKDDWKDKGSWVIYEDKTAEKYNSLGDLQFKTTLSWNKEHKTFAYTDEYNSVIILKLNKTKDKLEEISDPDVLGGDVIGSYIKATD